MSLDGKTLFITGASRGIGLAIALRAARDGANIAIAAKTTTPHPKLEGTIFTAAEPLSNPRMLMLWNALEAQDGFLYGQGTTNYGSSNPLVSVDRNGEFVLFYPGAAEPIPSARLEQVRDGIEDWAVLALVRQRWGAGAPLHEGEEVRGVARAREEPPDDQEAEQPDLGDTQGMADAGRQAQRPRIGHARLEIAAIAAAVIGGERRVIDRRAIGNDQEHLAFLGPLTKPLCSPHHSLAVHVLL